MAYERQDYLGTRAATTLNGSINNSVTSVTITSATGWPTVSNSGFYAVIDPDSADEEKVLVTARTGTGLTVTRGVDGTTGVAHASGATIRPCVSATDFDEANYMVSETVGNAVASGDLLVASAANNLTRLAKGSNSTILAVDSGGTLGYTTVTNAMVNASAAIDVSKLEAITTAYAVGNTSGSSAAPSAVSNASLTSAFGVWTTLTNPSDITITSTTSIDWTPNWSFQGFEMSGTVEFLVAFVYASPSGGTTPGLKIGVTTGDSRNITEVIHVAHGTGAATLSPLLTNAAISTVDCQTATSKRVALVHGYINSITAAETLAPYYAQVSSSANSTIIYSGSILSYRQIT